ncbi:coiled-coil domain-containing protein 12 isoform X1 [Equus asinus]|nr:coiled-coil domain-containing protein 12 isoform X1 [Equus caballus]XP_044610604.1 coiled-coil domain-containing protein 12 isoform X1 [Equus asinus]
MGQMRATWAARDSLDRDGSLTDSAGPLLPSPLSPSPQPAWEDFLLSHPRPWIGHERVIYSSGLRDAGRETRRAGKMAATPAGVGRLEEEALRRKERLKALREKTGRKDKEDGEPKTKQLREGEEEGEKHRELRLRNYVPEDEDLKRRRVPPAKPVAVEEKVKEQLEAAKPEPVIEEVDLANLAPRKPDWDLKRDVAKKLEKLEKRTQRAIAELIRERLKGQEDSLASAVDANTEQEACDSD